MSDAYREQVINLGDDASEMMYEACKLTWENREDMYGQIDASVDHFRGARVWRNLPLLGVKKPEGIIHSIAVDGIGTKILVGQRTANYETAAYDLIAMGADDPAAQGMEPILFATYLAVNQLNDDLKPYMEQLAGGVIPAAKHARIAMFGGETAVLGSIINGYGDPAKKLHYDWAATVYAVGHEERLIDGSAVRPGMSLVAFRDPAFRSNGISKVRGIAREHDGSNWHRKEVELEEGRARLGEAILRHSVIYTPVLVDATGGYDLRRKAKAPLAGVAHISGGGLWGKLGDMLNVAGYGADIEDPYDVPEIMKYIQEAGDVSDDEMYGVWHGGQGMVSATEKPGKLIKLAAKNGVEAKEIGRVTKKPGIRLRSAGAEKPGKKLTRAA